MSDYAGRSIQDLLNPRIPAHHIYLCVFPEGNKTYAIIAWLKEYDSLFATIKEKLLTLSDSEKRNYVNNTIPIISENIAIKPSSWDILNEQAKEEFSMLFAGMADFMEMAGRKLNRFEKPSFDLFEL